jgi:sugar phosphate isomerase/epimerase
MRRREFIPTLGLGSSVLIARARGLTASCPGQPPKPVGGGRPKLGSVSCNFHSLAPGAHPEEAIDIIAGLGFEGVELIANSRRDIDEYWTDATISRIRKQLERNRLEIPQFPFFQPVVEGLTSRDEQERKRSLDYFEAGCRIAKKLGGADG